MVRTSESVEKTSELAERIKFIASEILIFTLGLVLLCISIGCSVVNLARTARRQYEEIRDGGLRRSLFSSAASPLAFGIMALAAFLRADLRLMWTALAVFSFVSAALIMITAFLATGNEPARYPEITDERLMELKRKVILRGILRVVLLAVWVYSWRHLLSGIRAF